MYAGEGAGVSVHREGVSGVRSVTVKNAKQRLKQEVKVRHCVSHFTCPTNNTHYH